MEILSDPAVRTDDRCAVPACRQVFDVDRVGIPTGSTLVDEDVQVTVDVDTALLAAVSSWRMAARAHQNPPLESECGLKDRDTL